MFNNVLDFLCPKNLNLKIKNFLKEKKNFNEKVKVFLVQYLWLENSDKNIWVFHTNKKTLGEIFIPRCHTVLQEVHTFFLFVWKTQIFLSKFSNHKYWTGKTLTFSLKFSFSFRKYLIFKFKFFRLKKSKTLLNTSWSFLQVFLH